MDGCVLCIQGAGAWIIVKMEITEGKRNLSLFKDIQNRDSEGNQGVSENPEADHNIVGIHCYIYFSTYCIEHVYFEKQGW